MTQERHVHQSAAEAHLPLSNLRSGARARLHRADLRCDECELLSAMGLTDQCELRVCRAGEPCIVQVDAVRLGLSSSVARRIYVKPVHAAT